MFLLFFHLKETKESIQLLSGSGNLAKNGKLMKLKRKAQGQGLRWPFRLKCFVSIVQIEKLTAEKGMLDDEYAGTLRPAFGGDQLPVGRVMHWYHRGRRFESRTVKP